MPAKLEIPNLDDLIRRYLAGESVNQLARELGIARTPLTKRFKEAGVKIRSRSDAQRAKWQVLDAGERADLVARTCTPAWNGRRGQTDTAAAKEKRCLTRFRNQLHIAVREEMLAAELAKRGLDILQQYPVAGYNVDIALHESLIAVEIHGGFEDRPGRTTHGERAKDILDCCWAVVYVIHYGPNKWAWPFIPDVVAEQLVAFAERASRDESVYGKYGMIRSDGKGPARTECDFYGLPRIEGF